MNKPNEERCKKFQAILEELYAVLFKHDLQYAYSASRTTPAALAERMMKAIIKNDYNKDGNGVKWACAILKVPYTYKGIQDYLFFSSETKHLNG